MNVLNSTCFDVHDRFQSLIVQSLKAREEGDPGSTVFSRQHTHEGAQTVVQNEALIVELLQDLMMEVEALRAAMILQEGEAGGKESRYARTYLETARLTHYTTGPSTGLDKLLNLFYPADTDSDDRNWREALMLRRLGFSDVDIDQFKQEAKRTELNT